MIHKKILVVDDEENILELVKDILEAENYAVVTARTSDEAFKKIHISKPDLIILDLRFPSIGGIETCRILKNDKSTRWIPIIMLTVQSTETDKVIGLEIGADDYLTKPFGKRELASRVKALLRRVEYNLGKPEKKYLSSGTIRMCVESHTVSIGRKEIYLRPKEFELLRLFLTKKGKVLTREFLTESVLGYEFLGDSRAMDAHIKNLRKKLGKNGERIKTIIGVGYKFIEE